MQKVTHSDFGFLSQASDDLRELMTSLSTITNLAENEVLFEQGDPGDALYAIVYGRLEISVLSQDGRKLTLDVMRDGAILGEISLFDPGLRTATVTALEKTQVWGVRHADVLRALRDTPALNIDMIQLAGKRMRWMGMQLSEQVFLPMAARLARKILHLTSDDALGDQMLQMSQNDLAEFVGASREAVSKTLSVWRRDGIINLSRGGLRLLDREKLKKISESLNF